MAERRRMTVEDFLAGLGTEVEGYELIDGRPAVRGAGSVAHGQIVERVVTMLRRQLQGRPWRVASRVPLRTDRWDLLVADVVVSFQAFGQAEPECGEPAIVVEVSSGDTQARDRGEKWPKYATIESLQHFVLIATTEQRIESFARVDVGQWSYKDYRDGLHAVVALTALDICLFPAEIYQGVDLDRRTGPQLSPSAGRRC